MALSLAGCSAAYGTVRGGPDADDIYDRDASGEGGTLGPGDAGLGDASKLRGNPLCNASVFTCFPDEEKPIACTGVKDGGVDAGYGTVACRVDPKFSDPMCEPVPQAPMNEGESCTGANDCGAGFECVGSPARCRHYCCESATCTAYSKNNANKPYFCDIQPLASVSSQMVPVCQPVAPCNLQAQDCGSGQTCAIVESNGTLTTSCVAVGPGKVGDACDSQHCGLNLQCIGAPMPTCHQLCDPKMPQCPMGTTCFHQWPVLDQQGVGVCKEP
jgi:hypothetical protein